MARRLEKLFLDDPDEPHQMRERSPIYQMSNRDPDMTRKLPSHQSGIPNTKTCLPCNTNLKITWNIKNYSPSQSNASENQTGESSHRNREPHNTENKKDFPFNRSSMQTEEQLPSDSFRLACVRASSDVAAKRDRGSLARSSMLAAL